MTARRAQTVDYARISTLQYLGSYVRELPVNMARMMENALDWEHLPHVHASSFGAIEVLEAGRWGWRARALPAGGDSNAEGDWQTLELVLDAQKHYWATTVIAGPAASIEIHTQASALGPGSIQVDVRFYSSVPVPDEQVPLYLDVLRQQYALLYDEDDALMQGRQAALDERASLAGESGEREVLVGELARLPQDQPISVPTPAGRYCVRFDDGQWVVHSAVCPHLLGPLDTAPLAADGTVRCPWHGYRFHVATGENIGGQCRALPPPPSLVARSERLYLQLNAQ